MNIHIVNKEISVDNIKITAISSGSVFLIGDSQEITCNSMFDTPPEAVVFGPLVPVAPESLPG